MFAAARAVAATCFGYSSLSSSSMLMRALLLSSGVVRRYDTYRFRGVRRRTGAALCSSSSSSSYELVTCVWPCSVCVHVGCIRLPAGSFLLMLVRSELPDAMCTTRNMQHTPPRLSLVGQALRTRSQRGGRGFVPQFPRPWQRVTTLENRRNARLPGSGQRAAGGAGVDCMITG
jgi:hypothetical protein